MEFLDFLNYLSEVRITIWGSFAFYTIFSVLFTFYYFSKKFFLYLKEYFTKTERKINN